MIKDSKIDTKINYAKEMLIKNFPDGQAFASGQEVWVKISDCRCVVIGHARFVTFTHSSMAYPISSIEVYL